MITHTPATIYAITGMACLTGIYLMFWEQPYFMNTHTFWLFTILLIIMHLSTVMFTKTLIQTK